jgi:predicted ATPase
MLVDLTSRQAVLLVLDDLHTAPEATLQIVDSIVRLTQARRLMVMGTFRPEELTSNSPLRGMLGPGDRKGLCHELALPMLQRRECDDLVAALMAPEGPSPTLLDEVWAASSGNPFFITQTLRAVTRTSQPAIERGIWQAREHGTDAITPPIMWMVESYLRRADPRTRLVLSLVALAGPDVSFRELSLAAQEAVDPTLTKTMLLDILDPAVRSTVLAEHGEGYSFPYALFRAALCQDLSHQRREEFHAALAHAIEVHRPSEIAVLAHHSRRSQDVGRPSSQVGGGFRRDAG